MGSVSDKWMTQLEINQIDFMFELSAKAHQEIGRFYVPMQETVLMDELNSLQHLKSNH